MSSPNLHIHTLRGLAILAIVLVHTALLQRVFSGEAGLPKEAFGNFLDRFSLLIEPIRIPLFTVISGWVYACRPVEPGHLGQFFLGKAHRIGVPLLVVSIMEFGFQALRARFAVPPQGGPPSFLDFLYLAPSHLWFLYAILWIFLFVAIAETVGLLRSVLHWLLVTLVAFGGYFLGPNHWNEIRVFDTAVPNHLRFFSGLLLLGFFLFGLGLNRFSRILIRKLGVWISAALTVGFLLAIWTLAPTGPSLLAQSLNLGLALGGIYLLVALPWTWRPLAEIGTHSLPIYLYHGFAIYLAFTLMKWMNSNSWWLFLPFGILFGVALPILFSKLVSRWQLGRRLFLGLK